MVHLIVLQFIKGTHLTIILILLTSISGFAQSIMNFEKIDQSNGLSSNSIRAITQDSKGFIWFGTLDGLNKYDGIEIRTIRFSSDHNLITSIHELSSGNIMIGTIGGLIEFNPLNEEYKAIKIDTSGNHNSIVFIHEDKLGAIWVIDAHGSLLRRQEGNEMFINYVGQTLRVSGADQITYFHEGKNGKILTGTGQNGLFEYGRKNDSFREIKDDENESLPPIQQIYTDEQNQVWVATKKGLFLQKTDQDQFDLIIEKVSVNSIWEDENSELWISYDEHILRYNVQTSAFDFISSMGEGHLLPHIIDLVPISKNSTYIHQNTIVSKSVVVDQDNKFWMISSNGIEIFDPQLSKFIPIRPEDEFNNMDANRVTTILQGQSNSLWFGSIATGIFKYTPTPFLHYSSLKNTSNSMGNREVHAINVENNSKVWIGTVKGKFDLFDRNKEQFTRYQVPGIHTTIFDILPQKEQIWITTYGNGLVNYDRIKDQYSFYSHDIEDSLSIQNDKIQSILEDKYGNLWIGSIEGVDIFNPATQKFHRLDLEDQKGNTRINVFEMKAYGDDIWLGTLGNGLFVVDSETLKYKNYVNIENDSLSINYNYVTSIHRDLENENLLWLGTYGGGINILNVKNETFVSKGKDAGLLNDVIYGIMEDSIGHIWFSSNAGLSIFDKKESKVIRHFKVKDGLQSNEFNRGCYGIFPDETMIFGGINGINIFNPHQSDPNEFEPYIALTNFKLFNKNRKDLLEKAVKNESITLPYDQNFISLDFSVLDYRNTDRNEYAYRLVGLMENWTSVSNKKPYATYTALPPGNYSFELRARDSRGNWLNNMLEVPIVITPPYWGTWWFRLMLAIILLGLIITIYNVRLMSLKKQRIKLMKEVKERTQALGDLNQHLEMRIQERTRELEDHAFYNSHELRKPVSNILGLVDLFKLKPDKNNIEEIVTTLKTTTIELDKKVRNIQSKLGKQK